jgi:acetyltransferase-like isoleucine patch superfamily enzyme
MSIVDGLILRIKRAETPPTRLLKRLLRSFFNPTLPPIPRVFLAPLRLLYEVHFLLISVFRWVLTVFYRNPMFQSRCASFGRRVSMDGLPFVSGHVRIYVGDDVKFGGGVSISSARVFDEPKLIMKDRSGVGWGTWITVNREVILEEDVIVSFGCRISDSDGHCREADLRAAGTAPKRADIRPVRICKHAWIGNGTHIMKGVTIGEGAVIGANSVVITNIPAYSLAMGNPAEVLFRNYGRPSTESRKTGKPADAGDSSQRSE